MRGNFTTICLLVAFAVLAGSCGGDGGSDGNAVSEATFETWDAFLTRDKGEADQRKVVFIGLDGATWDVIDPFIAKGSLPNFARMKQEGAWGTLRSTETYVSPPAWTAMMTGFLPERTGIYSFGHWSPEQQKFLPLRSTDVLVPPVWDIASLGGARTAALNVPVTYPVHDINGIMVSGLLTPTRLADREAFEVNFAPVADPVATMAPRSYSPLLRARLDNDGNRFDIYLVDSMDDGRKRYDRVHLEVRNAASAEPGIYRFGSAVFSNWVKVNVETEEGSKPGWVRLGLIRGDKPNQYYLRCSHTLWSSSETDVEFTSPPQLADDIHKQFKYYFPSTYLDGALVPGHTELATKWASYFFDYDDWDLFLFVFTQTDNVLHEAGASPVAENVFRIIDKFLGDLMAKLPDNYTLILGSDHGFAEYDLAVDMNRLFEGIGLVKYKDDRDLDFDRTLAFHNMWGIYFNDAILSREELRRRGIDCADGVDPHDALAAFIRSESGRHLSGLGHAVPLEFSAVSENAAGQAPDLFVKGSYDRYEIELWNINKPRPDIVSPLQGGARWFHTRRGIFAARGPDIRAGVEIAPTDIHNMTPTFLYLLGLPAPTNIDGRIITEAFEPSALASRPRYVISDYTALPKTIDVSDDQREDLEKQLRSLGYIR